MIFEVQRAQETPFGGLRDHVFILDLAVVEPTLSPLLFRRMRENIFQHNNLPVPPEPIDPMDRANLAPPVYGAINYLGDPHGGAPKYSGIAKARGTAPDPHGDSHFGHHFVYKPDSNHLLSYFPSDSLQLWSHGKFPISTTRQGLWNSLGPVSEEVMEKFMSMSRDSAQRGVYRQTNYLEVNIHRNQTPFGYEHISKVVMDHRDERLDMLWGWMLDGGG